MKPFRWLAAIVATALLGSLLSACSPGDGGKDGNNRRMLRIGLPYGSEDNESYTRQDLTDLFEVMHPEIDIELVYAVDDSGWMYGEAENEEQPDVVENMKKMLTGPNPVDVVVFSLEDLTWLVQDNLLKPLDPFMAEDKMDTAAFVPMILEAIRERGDGQQLYALAPSFSAAALFYNKALFREQNVPFPDGDMTWEDALNLARRLKSGSGPDAVFGISFSSWAFMNLFSGMSMYSDPLQLRMFDDQAEKMTVNTPGWKDVWDTFFSLYDEGVIPRQEDLLAEPLPGGEYRYNPYRHRPFFSGRVAMVVETGNFIQELLEFNRVAERLDMEPIEWGVTALPAHPQMPEVGVVSIGRMMGINANALNQEDAWSFIKFHHSGDMAKIKSRSNYEMSTLQAYLTPREGADYDPAVFTKRKPGRGMTLDEIRLQRERPNLYLVQQLAERIFDRVIAGEMTVEEGLAKWEETGNKLLQKIKENPRGPISDPFDGLGGGGAVEIMF
jgi:multiple sugar transport system substrate-binding protein